MRLIERSDTAFHWMATNFISVLITARQAIDLTVYL